MQVAVDLAVIVLNVLKLVLASKRKIASAALVTVVSLRPFASRMYCRYLRLIRSFSSVHLRAIWLAFRSDGLRGGKRNPLGLLCVFEVENEDRADFVDLA